MATTMLPPWGVMHKAYMDEMDAEPVPKDWRPLDGSSPNPSNWSNWMEQVTDEIADFLWPRYNVSTSSWEGASTANMEALTAADFELLSALHSYLEGPISGRFATNINHGDFFALEDTKPLGENYAAYDALLPRDLRNTFPKILKDGYANKVGSYDLQLKWRLQRPRPLQVSYILGRNDFSFRLAVSANTPSLVSGHCLQGSLAGCNAFAELISNSSVDATSIEVLKQFTVDIGDRRVFAGVHYPSDNISSWYSAFRIIPYVFSNSEPAKFLWSAIKSKSVVFAAMQQHVAANSTSPFKNPIEALETLASKA